MTTGMSVESRMRHSHSGSRRPWKLTFRQAPPAPQVAPLPVLSFATCSRLGGLSRRRELRGAIVISELR